MAERKVELLELLKLEYKGPNEVKVNHCLIRGTYPTEEFIKVLSREEKASLTALFKLFDLKKGKISNYTKFKKLEQYLVAIFEFKDYQVRLAGFWKENYNFNLLYGFKKKKDSWPSSDLKAMRSNYDEFIREEQNRKGKRRMVIEKRRDGWAL